MIKVTARKTERRTSSRSGLPNEQEAEVGEETRYVNPKVVVAVAPSSLEPWGSIIILANDQQWTVQRSPDDLVESLELDSHMHDA
jgi:hypothetical protein